LKKKKLITNKDRKDWFDFTQQSGKIYNKDRNVDNSYSNSTKTPKLDLHGFSLKEANEIVKKFIFDSYNKNCKKLLIVTGKGLRSKVYNDPYRSEKMSVLKNSIPEYIKNDENLSDKIIKIKKADDKDGGDGAIQVILKNKF
jgi:DNA-nicking Smr family endonuclease